MNKQLQAAAAILAVRKHNLPHMMVLTDVTDAEADKAYKQAQVDHPLLEIHMIIVRYE